jgi:hypothetical protein
MELNIANDWNTFEDYLAALSSKYRVRANKIVKTSSSIQRIDFDSEKILQYQTEIKALYHQVADKVDFNLAVLPDDYFYAQKKNLPSKYHFIGYFYEEKLVGFITIFELDDKAEVHYIGLDYAVNKSLHLYQSMLYDMIKFGINNKVSHLHFGRTAPEVKSTIGAKALPMFGFIKHRNSLVNAIMGFFTARLKPRAYILRNPFKEN